MDHGIQLAASNRNLSYQLAKKLGIGILTGKFDQEGILPGELELCKKHKLSRTAVREAIKILTAKGMVLPRPKIGTRVLPQKYWNFLDYDLLLWIGVSKNSQLSAEFERLRRVIEPEVIYQFAINGDGQQLKQLTLLLDKMTRFKEEKDQLQWYQTQVEFYQLIYLEARNRFFIPIGNLFPLIFPKKDFRTSNYQLTVYFQLVKAIQEQQRDKIQECCLTLLK
ncbi:GntR family transcriptional regulator [Vibrio sp. SS-MA-C1-2]|uniref:FadR/GntR family transcriptional regulator n=1 Tax=Vibrio sp. SS-MA-C1-2 TaxID=2908646 RepID=UPI001F3D7078|nr:GntR family transcriptional regulator [Vibrio sp. SS-MA-C1-2]UJF19352.1 GntR family transcriptional regulator [Vibrio sp. SS-MA-C1-2]